MDFLELIKNPFSAFFQSLKTKDELSIERDLEKNSIGLSQQEIDNGNYGDYNNIPIDFQSIYEHKAQKIRAYREMANYPEISEIVDNVVDESIVFDREGKFADFIIKNPKDIPEKHQKALRKEYNYVMDNVFKSKERMWDYFEKWLIDGELYLEIVMSSDKKNIVGLKPLPAHTMTPVYDGNVIKGFIQRIGSDGRDIKTFEDNQVLYINYGKYGQSLEDVNGYLQPAMRTYNQLKSLEDAVVVYRIARAPEKRVFNIETGNMPKGKAEEFIKKIINKYKKQSIYDPETGKVSSTHNIQSLLEDFFFSQSDGKGSTVSSLNSGMNLGEIDDVKYFLQKLYKSLKLPKGRWEDTVNIQYSSGKDITREEVKFGKFVERLQNRFKQIVMDAFVIQIRACGNIDKKYVTYSFIQQNYDIRFIKNNLYSEFRDLELLETRIQIFSSIEPYMFSPNNPAGVFSREYALKKYFLMDDESYLENKRLLDKEKEESKTDDTFDTGFDSEEPDSEKESPPKELEKPTESKQPRIPRVSLSEIDRKYGRLFLNNT